VILFGDQVLDRFAPLELARRSEPNGNWAALVKATLTIAAINQWLRWLRALRKAPSRGLAAMPVS
jgi:hypothetical protein